MSKEIYISSTPHETRLAIVENDALTEIYYERENEYTLAGSIYNGKVTRVLPGMQSSFVDIGLDRDAFLYITDFMEEAGEAADFEGSGEPRREPRNGTPRDGAPRDAAPRENGRGNRADRPALPRPEPSDAELFTEAVSSIDPSRPVSDAERGSRRGGRNRRDRDRNAEGRRDQGRPPVAPPVDAPRPEPVLVSPPPVESAGELGEGAPGADGSRRWRGRRGRRGNRGPGSGQPRMDANQPVAEAPLQTEDSLRTESTGPMYNAYGPEVVDEEPGFFEAAEPIAEPTFAERPPQREGSRGDRNRGRDRDRGPQAARVPRGFTPSQDLYQVDGAAEAPPYGVESFEAAPIEPLILPGESLSKYRSPDPSQPAARAAEPAPAPVSDFIAAGWDGGAVLPGETIRPRSASLSPAGDAPPEFGRREARGDRNDRNHGGGRREERGPRPESPRQAAPVVAPPEFAAEPELAAPATPEPVAEVETEAHFTSHVVTPIDSTFVPPPPMPEPEPAEPEPIAAMVVVEPETAVIEEPELVEHVQEYEPAEASACYRIDPVAPIEYRQSAPLMEEQFEFEEEIVEEQPVAAPVAAAPEVLEVVQVELFVSEPLPAEPEHEVTSIFPTGEMHSEPPALTTQELVAPAPSAQGPEQSAEPVAAEVAASDQSIPWFAPGAGLLEEEVLEDEDEPAILPVVNARYDSRERDTQEQETLDNAADLGAMLREMSIDQLTHSEAATEEDEDFDEDFLEEDQDYSLEVSDTEDFEEEKDEAGHPEYASDEDDESDFAPAEVAVAPPADSAAREPRRERNREDRNRRDGRRGDRNRRSGSGGAERGNSASDRPAGDRERSHHHGRQSMQSTNMPAISDLLKPGQELLCQIAKEPIAKKGARITSHIALPGRFLVFMPTVHHTGVSRKIESDGERRRLKEILLSEKGDAAGGFIVRTAAAGASEEELRSDLRFLLNLWADIKTRSESSKSPALIYHDLNLVERVLRDQVTDNFSAIWVDTETDYERILRFLQRFQPSLIRRVKLYTKETPLFEQFGITEEINKALRSKVWLKSGGSIVINQTEALVAIDINTGKFVGKTARLEDTIVKTNLDAIPEIVRQIRLRDLGGIIIIDFIDMDERKNRNKVMAALEEELKSDRAPSKVLPFNDFGLVAITRKRVKQSLERTLSTTCNVCQGTGMVKSPITVCNDIYIEMRKMQKHLDRGDVMLRVHPDVVKQLKSTTSRWLQEMEEMVGKTILVKSDPSLHPEQFDLH
jgi:ribonuclease E